MRVFNIELPAAANQNDDQHAAIGRTLVQTYDENVDDLSRRINAHVYEKLQIDFATIEKCEASVKANSHAIGAAIMLTADDIVQLMGNAKDDHITQTTGAIYTVAPAIGSLILLHQALVAAGRIQTAEFMRGLLLKTCDNMAKGANAVQNGIAHK